MASAIHNESSGNKEESFRIGNIMINYIESQRGTFKTVEDIVMYSNSIVRGAKQKFYTAYLAMNSQERNSRYALAATINALGLYNKIEGFGFSDETNKATGWDGKELVRKYEGGNPRRHLPYVWSEASRDMLREYQRKFGDGTIDVDDFHYSNSNYNTEATAIIGGTLYQNRLKGGLGGKRYSDKRFQ